MKTFIITFLLTFAFIYGCCSFAYLTFDPSKFAIEMRVLHPVASLLIGLSVIGVIKLVEHENKQSQKKQEDQK